MPTTDEEKALAVAEADTEEAGAMVSLLGSRPVRGAYRTIWVQMSVTVMAIQNAEKSKDEIQTNFDRALTTHHRLMDMLRIDLGVDPEDPENRELYRKRSEEPAAAEASEPASETDLKQT